MPAKKGVLLLGVLLAGGFFQVKAVFGSYEIDKNAPRDKPVSIQIAAIPQSIRVGEPILLKVTCTFSRPQIHLQTREIVGSIYKENILFVEVKDKSRMPPRRKYVSIDGKEYEAHYLLLRKFFLWDAKGLVYSNYCSVYLAPEKAGRNEKDIFTSFLFDEPGRYTIFIDQGEAKSNRLTIDVSPPAKTSSILIPMDYVAITEYYTESQSFYPPNVLPQALQRLRRFADQKSQTVFTQLSAAWLGLFYATRDEIKEHQARQEKKILAEPLYGDAIKYLRQGLRLPDDFLIRDEMLNRLAEIEGKRKNYDQAIVYLTELAEKYPKGRRGQYALRDIKEIDVLRRKEDSTK